MSHGRQRMSDRDAANLGTILAPILMLALAMGGRWFLHWSGLLP